MLEFETDCRGILCFVGLCEILSEKNFLRVFWSISASKILSGFHSFVSKEQSLVFLRASAMASVYSVVSFWDIRS